MAQWNDIPLELWTKIAESIHYFEDFDTFGKVCSVWRTAMKSTKRTKSSTQAPWLLLAESPWSSKLRFYSICNKKVLSVELPKLPATRQWRFQDLISWVPKTITNKNIRLFGLGDWRYLSSRGWLICVPHLGLNITLMNPISKQVIQPPAFPDRIVGPKRNSRCWNSYPYTTWFPKVLLSENPSTSNDYILAMITPFHLDLAFWKSGDKEWTVLRREYSYFVDITFYRGEFYAVSLFGKVIAIRNSSPPADPRLVAMLRFPKYPDIIRFSAYLVESAGKLLVVLQEVERNDDENEDIITVELRCFKVWEIDVDTGEATTVNDLGNRALFLGHNSSFSIEACPPVSRPNCIYHTDIYLPHDFHLEKVTRCDMGVYDLSLGRKIEEFYQGPSCFSSSTLPLWVETP